MSSINKQIKLGAVISYLSLFINIVISLIYTPWMVSKIGQSSYALYTLATSFISLFMVDFGLSASVSRYIAKYRAEGDNKNQIEDFVSTVEWLYIIIDSIILIILALVYAFLPNIYHGLTADELKLYRYLFIIVGVYSILSFPFLPLSGIINAYEKFIQQKLCDLFQKVFSIILIVIALCANLDVKAIVLANAISGIVTIIIKLWIIRKSIHINIGLKKFKSDTAKNVFSFSIWITIISLAQRCVFNLAPTILGVVSNSKEIAVFSPANALEGYFYSFAAAVNGLFLATVSRHIANNEENKIFDLMVKVGKYQMYVMGFVYIGFLSVGRDFMIAWMGIDYVKSWPCALLMFIPDILIFTQQIANTTAIAKNKVMHQSWGYIGMAAICIGLSFVLCGKYGVIGTAIAIMVSYMFLFIYMNILYHRVLNLNMFLFFKRCYLKVAFPLVMCAISSFFICNKIPYKGWLSVLIKSAVVIFIYIPVALLSLSTNERGVLFSKFKWKLKHK